MVKGKLYVTAGSRRAVVCLDAATGELIWMHSENEGVRAENAPRQFSGHGVAYWTDGKDERILYVTTGYRLISLDAKTGIPVRTFGTDGVVDLKQRRRSGDGPGHRAHRAAFHSDGREERRDRGRRHARRQRAQEQDAT